MHRCSAALFIIHMLTDAPPELASRPLIRNALFERHFECAESLPERISAVVLYDQARVRIVLLSLAHLLAVTAERMCIVNKHRKRTKCFQVISTTGLPSGLGEKDCQNNIHKYSYIKSTACEK